MESLSELKEQISAFSRMKGFAKGTASDGTDGKDTREEVTG